MYEIKTEIEINSSAQQVWSVLVNFNQHSSWDPFIREISGVPTVGTKLKVSLQPPGGKSMTFSPTVIAAVPDHELRWLGRLLVPGLFDGEHYFQIIPLGSDKVRFIQGERFSGLLVGFLKSSLDKGTRAGFDALNRAIKIKVESGGS